MTEHLFSPGDADMAMWTDTAEQINTEGVVAMKSLAQAAVEPLWPYLSAATTRVEFEHRMGMVEDGIATRVAAVLGDDWVAVDTARKALLDRYVEQDMDRTANVVRSATAGFVLAGDGQTAQVMAFPMCDICKYEHGVETEARYDGKTLMGPWANMCEKHFKEVGTGLGTGRGQRLELAPSSKTSAMGDWVTITYHPTKDSTAVYTTQTRNEGLNIALAKDSIVDAGGVIIDIVETDHPSVEASAKSNVCPKCGATMSDVTVQGNTLRAKCGSCGWSGTKTRKASAKTASGYAIVGKDGNPLWGMVYDTEEGARKHHDSIKGRTDDMVPRGIKDFTVKKVDHEPNRTYSGGSNPFQPLGAKTAGPLPGYWIIDGVRVWTSIGDIINTMDDWGALYDKGWIEKGWITPIPHNSGGLGGADYQLTEAGKAQDTSGGPKPGEAGWETFMSSSLHTAKHPGAQGYATKCPKCGSQTKNADRGWVQFSECPKCNWIGHKVVTMLLREAVQHTAAGAIQWTTDTHMGVGFLVGLGANGDVYECYYNPNSNPTPCSWVRYGPEGDTGPNSMKEAGRGFTTMQDAMRAAEANAGQPSAVQALLKGAPFAGYEDFEACVRANSDKDDPEAYCGKIKHQVEDKKASAKTAEREIVDAFHGKYVKERKGTQEYRYYPDGSVTILDMSKPSGTNRTIGHTGPNPERIPPEFAKTSAVYALLAEAAAEYGTTDTIPDDLAQAAAKYWFGDAGTVEHGAEYGSAVAPDGGSYKIKGTRIRGGGESAIIYVNTPSKINPNLYRADVPYSIEFYDGSGGDIKPDPNGGWIYEGMGGTRHFGSLQHIAAEGWIDAARRVVANHQHEEVDGVLLDAFTASAMVQVFDGLSPENATKFGSMPIEQAASIAMKILTKAGSLKTADLLDDVRGEGEERKRHETYWGAHPEEWEQHLRQNAHLLVEAVSVQCSNCGKTVNRNDAYIRGGLVGDDWGQTAYCPDCAEKKGLTDKKAAVLKPHLPSWLAGLKREAEMTNSWQCPRCGETVERWRGESNVSCPGCDAQFNAAGNLLRDDWASNRSNFDDEVGDMEGYEDSFHDASRRQAGFPEPSTDLSGGWARKGEGGRPEYWGSYQHGDTGQVIHMYRGKGNKVRFYDDENGQQVGDEQSNVAPAAAWALSNGYHNPDLAGLGPIGGSRTAVNEGAQGTERYQSLPAPAKPSWITEWADKEMKATKEMTEQGLNAYIPPNPFPNLTTLQQVRKAALKVAGEDGFTEVGEVPLDEENAATGETIDDPNDPTTGDFGEPLDTVPKTTKPRQVPGGDSPGLLPVEVLPDPVTVQPQMGQGQAEPQMGSGGGFDMGYAPTQDPMLPTTEQMVAAKVARLADRIMLDNPSMELPEAKRLAALTVAKHPEMVKASR